MSLAPALLAAPLLAALAIFAGGPAAAQVAIVEGGANYSLNVISMRDIPFRTVVRQQYDYSCGSAALATRPCGARPGRATAWCACS